MNDDLIRQQERVFDGRKFAVDVVEVAGRDGQSVQRELVVHGGAVAIVGRLDDGRIVMIRNHRFAVGKRLWELPAGTLERGEDPADCAARELEEETGYRPAHVELLCRFYTSPGFCTEQMHAYLATGLTHVGQNLESGEHIDVELITADRLLTMIRSGEIEDAKTIATILYYQTCHNADAR